MSSASHIDVSHESADVLIVGGAVVGSAVAFFLRRLGFAGRVVVVERDTTYAGCATTRSAGGIRTQFSTVENIKLSRASLDIIRELGLAGEVAFREQGYLILSSQEGLRTLAANVVIQQREGADVALEDQASLGNRFPWLSTDGIAAGSRGRSGEGWIDPASLMAALRREAQARGVEIVRGEVCAIDRSGQRVVGVRLTNGGRISCGLLVNAAGPQAGDLARMAGVALPVEPRKRYVYVLDHRGPPPGLAQAPLTVDPSGVWFRPEGRTFICGRSPAPGEEPADLDLDRIDHDYFDTAIWPALAARVPAFEAIKVVNAWAGHYDYNTLDQNGIVGRHPEIANLYLCNGFSGHGLQQAPAAGRAIAELIVRGRFATIDLTRLGYERVARGEPLLEANVI
jgi:FAD-dependent oxidoreductase domain-containing protein 1